MPRSLRDRGAMASSATSRAAKELSRAFESGVLLAHTYEKEKPPPNPKGWWISGKLDGVRAYWNGADFFTRTGTRIHAPGFFKEGLPANVHLDGELWKGREAFGACVGIVRSTDASGRAEEWRDMKYIMFDAPVVDGKVDVPYEARHAACEAAAAAAPFASAVAVRKCTGKAHMEQLLRDVITHGGEGLMLREPGSLYERTRSHSLLKVKTFLDAEAKVVGYSKDSKVEGCMGALECEMPVTGARFKVGSGFTQAQRPLAAARKEWPVGTVISYKYQGLTTANGKPRFPTYLRIRSDKTWDDVVVDAQADLRRAEEDAGGVLVRAPSIMEATSLVRPRDSKCKAAAAEDDGDGNRGGGGVDGDGGAAEAVVPKAQKGKQAKKK